MEPKIDVAVLLDGDALDAATLAEANSLADREAARLTILMVAPRVVEWALWLAGVDPDQMRREIEIEERARVRDALRQAGVGGGYRLEVVDRRCSDEQLERMLGGCATVVVPVAQTRLARRIRRIAERVAVVPVEAGRRAPEPVASPA